MFKKIVMIFFLFIGTVVYAQNLGYDTGLVMLGAYSEMAGGAPVYYDEYSLEHEAMVNQMKIDEPKVKYEKRFQPVYLQDEMNKSDCNVEPSSFQFR